MKHKEKILILIALLLLGYKVATANREIKKPTMLNPSEKDIIKALQTVANKWGADVAEIIEKMLRLETSHFKSRQFKVTGTAGMEAAPGKTEFPYGWTSAREFWLQNPQYKPTGIFTMAENTTGINKPFLKFPSLEAAFMTMAHILGRRGFNPGSWYSTSRQKQEYYNNALKNITARYKGHYS